MPCKPLPREDSLGLPGLLNHSIIRSYLGLQSSSFYRLQPLQVIKYLKAPPTSPPRPPRAQHERLSTKLTLWSCGEAFGTTWASVRALLALGSSATGDGPEKPDQSFSTIHKTSLFLWSGKQFGMSHKITQFCVHVLPACERQIDGNLEGKKKVSFNWIYFLELFTLFCMHLALFPSADGCIMNHVQPGNPALSQWM